MELQNEDIFVSLQPISKDFGDHTLQPTNGKWEWTGPNGFHSYERHNQIFDFNEKMVGNYIGTYTNEAGCRQQLVITLKMKE